MIVHANLLMHWSTAHQLEISC